MCENTVFRSQNYYNGFRRAGEYTRIDSDSFCHCKLRLGIIIGFCLVDLCLKFDAKFKNATEAEKIDNLFKSCAVRNMNKVT